MEKRKLEDLHLLDDFLFGSMESYTNLKNVFVILITPYDPFHLNRMVYTIRNACEEVPSLPYDDGAKTIFLYTKGTEGNPSEELLQLLHYMEHTKEETAVNDSLKELHQMVNVVKHDREVSLNYMKSFERDQMLIKQGLSQGLEQGLEQGLSQGLEQGLKQGREQERANTERERLRAEHAEKQLALLKKQLDNLTLSSEHS